MSPITARPVATRFGGQRRSMAGDASTPVTANPRSASGMASRPVPTPELQDRAAAGQSGQGLDAGRRVGDVAVPVVVDVGEPVAIGRPS